MTETHIYHKQIYKKTINKKSIVSVIGLGYVGLPLSLNLIKNKIPVIGIDTDYKKIIKLKKKTSYISTISSKILSKYEFNNLSTQYSIIKNSDIIIYCLPTPINKKKTPNLSILKNAIRLSAKNFKKGQLIILESTTYPGCTEELFLPLLKKLKFKIDNDIFLGYSPEREDPGNKRYNIRNVIKVVSGVGPNSLKLASKFYESSNIKVHKVSNIKTAEMTKLLENTYRNINIGYANEMKIICKKLNLDINEVINSAKTKPFGFTPFYPGPGIGGHCIPVDPHYLLWKLEKNKYFSNFIKASTKINDAMPKFIFKESFKILKKNFKNFRSIKVLFVGLAYKKNIDDLRESPSLALINEFINRKFLNIFYHDPFHKKGIPHNRNFNYTKIKYSNINKSTINKFDVIYLLTDHDDLNYPILNNANSIIFDTRNVLEKRPNIINL